MKSIHRHMGIIAVVGIALGCASSTGTWESARQEDTPGSYHRFLRAHPDSPLAPEARERMALARLRKKPTAEGFAQFRTKYPDSELLAEIEPIVEPAAFEWARMRGTREAYAEFLAEFPDGPNADRAAGNIEYLEQDGFAGRPADLLAFATRHPSSDFAAEAGRSVASIDARRRTALHHVGLVVEIEEGTPGTDRLVRTFAERASRQFAGTGIDLVPLAGPSDPRASGVDAILTIRHGEKLVQPKLGTDRSFSAGVLATTKVTLVARDDAQVIASEEFSYKVPLSAYREGEPILFGPDGNRYWESFYLPVATWSTQFSARAPFSVRDSVVAVEALDHRAVLLFQDGSFEVVDLSDPDAPGVVARYRRPADLKKWSDVRAIDGRFVIFGEDGLEIIGFDSGAPRRLVTIDRAKVGGVTGVEKTEAGILVAGSRGLLLLTGGSAEPQVLFEKSVYGMATRGERVIFTDGSSLFVATMQMLKRRKAESELRIGKGFAPGRIRVWGATAVVVGSSDVMLVDLSNPANPRVHSRIRSADVGAISDAIAARGRLFLLGDRGLQVSDASGTRVEEFVDVAARTRLVTSGRHLVLVGAGNLQVVDTTPFVAAATPAAPRR